MNSIVADAINYIYDQKILELRNHIQIDIEKFNAKLISKEYFDYTFEIYRKKIMNINTERLIFLQNLNKTLQDQETINFLSTGERMRELRVHNRGYYNYVVDKAFALNTPLSTYKFKYAGY